MIGSWKALLGVLLVFILGTMAGVLSTWVYIHHARVDFFRRGGVAYVEFIENRLTSNLHLDEDQKRQVHELLMQNLEDRQRLQSQIQPQMQDLNRQTLRQIQSILRPDQAATLRANRERLRIRFGRPAGDENNP